MASKYVCDACGVAADAQRGRQHNLPPLGWFVGRKATPEDRLEVCSGACVTKLEKEVKTWHHVDQDFKALPIGVDECRWCHQLGRLCPPHNKQMKRKGA